ncbi:MAG: hypothetical protein HZA22_02630 [Nitrospirae bacterium]|nr:hypothetical protein [Nitrospirota bacterium]
MSEHHDHGHDDGHGHEKLVKVTLYLEDDHIYALDRAAGEYSKLLGQRWSRGAVVRLALSDFFSRRGEIT